MGGNLFWGNHLHYFGDKISLNGRPSPISLILHQNNAKHYRHYFDCRGFATNLKKIVIARRIVDSPKQSKQNNRASAHRISPDSWCKKSESKGAVVPPADFLLESEKRGSPPKSEKAAAFWRVGGAGRGVQPFLRKEKGDKELADSKADLSAESHYKIVYKINFSKVTIQ